MAFLAGNDTAYRKVLAVWPRIYTLVTELQTESDSAAQSTVKVASPIKGSIFNFLDMNSEMAMSLPAASSVQHLARCILQPAWVQESGTTSSSALLSCLFLHRQTIASCTNLRLHSQDGLLQTDFR